MNRMNVLATATLAAVFALGYSPASWAGDPPPSGDNSQPAAPQPAANSQPTADERLQELEKEVNVLQQEIAALKQDESTPSVKTAALLVPDPNASPAALGPGAAAPADEAPKINLAGLLGPITISGFGDVYYSYDNNHPGNNQSGFRFFESPTNGFSFNMAEVILDKAPDASSSEGRLGYHIAAGYGQAAKIVNGSDAPFTDGSNFFLKEAYLDYLAPVGKGLTITVGKFVTNAGAEVIESNANWNYTRSLLFYYAIPFFHFGAKAAYTFNPHWSANVSLVNGWNNTVISHQVFGGSSGLTYGGTVTYTPSMKLSVAENYYAGPIVGGGNVDGTFTDNFWRHISDTVIGYTPNMKWAFQLNGDYGFVEHVTPKNLSWWGVAGYAKYTLNPKSNLAVRYEYYDDANGVTGLLTNTFAGGVPGWAQEVTGTYSYNLTSALLLRGEYRYDFANQPVFQQGPAKFVKEQNTAYVSFVYSFSSANMK